MSLMGTLAKVAVGVAVAKGVGGMLSKGSSAPQGGGLFGQAAQAKTGGGLENMLGAVLGGQGSSGGLGGILESIGGAAGASGGLNGVLGQLAGGSGGGGGGGLGGMLGQLAGNSSSVGGGLGGLLGQLTGGFQGGGGGLGGMIGGLMGGAGAAAATNSFGNMLNQAIASQDEPDEQPTAEQEALAALMLRAMIQAMKCDGNIDQDEEKRLLGRLGDVSDEERAFVTAEMKKKTDAKALAADVPKGLEAQIYTMSVMGIDLDNQAEAQYLDQLASAMGLSHDAVNEIHNHLGVPTLYT